MAYMAVRDYLMLGGSGCIDAVSYQIALDEGFSQIIDQSLKDYDNIDGWYSMLPRRDDPTKFYKDERNLWMRIKVHSGSYESLWYTKGPLSQRPQEVILTELNQPDILTNSAELGWE